jgi:hypothetical protein
MDLILEGCPAPGESAGQNTSLVGTSDKEDIKREIEFPQANFETITCSSMRAENLRASFDIDSDRIIVAIVTARAFNREGLDDDTDEMIRDIWRLMRASVTPARQELQRLRGRL